MVYLSEEQPVDSAGVRDFCTDRLYLGNWKRWSTKIPASKEKMGEMGFWLLDLTMQAQEWTVSFITISKWERDLWIISFCSCCNVSKCLLVCAGLRRSPGEEQREEIKYLHLYKGGWLLLCSEPEAGSDIHPEEYYYPRR